MFWCDAHVDLFTIDFFFIYYRFSINVKRLKYQMQTNVVAVLATLEIDHEKRAFVSITTIQYKIISPNHKNYILCCQFFA